MQRIRRVVALDSPIDDAHARLSTDPLVGPLVTARPGARLPGAWDPFEVGVRAIIGQQVSVAGANTITARLVTRHGQPVPGLAAMGLTHLFPDAEVLADDDTDLAGLGLTTARAGAIRSFAAAVAADEIRFDRSEALEALVAAVTSVPGLGPWTAHYLALRLGEPDAFPATDLALRRSAARLSGSPLTHRQLEQLSEAWRPHRATAALHLWLADRD